MADPRTMPDDLLERIDAVVYHHEQLSQWNEPDSDGPIYPQQVERARLAAGGTTVTWVPQPADPEHPTLAELQGGVDLTVFLAGEPLIVQRDDRTGMLRVTSEHGTEPADPPARPWWQRFARWPNV